MSLWGALTGSDARRYATDAYNRNSREMQTGYDRSMGYQGQGYQSAVNRLSPYAQAGQQGQQAYTNLLGLNGQQAQQGARQGYEGWNPYLTDGITAASKALDRRNASVGQGPGGGMNALARARVGTEMGSQDFYNYNNHLQGLGQQGFQAANMLAGYDQNNAAQQIAIENALRNGNVQNSTQFGNAQAQAGQGALNNVLGIAGLGLNAFMPGVGGKSAIGNMMGMFGGGMNSTKHSNFDHGYRP